MIALGAGEGVSTSPTFDIEREAEFDYKTCAHSGAGGRRIEMIYLGIVDGKHLVAVPQSAWHKNSNRRQLGAALSRPVLVEMTVAREAERETEVVDLSMKVWLGLVAGEVVDNLSLVVDRETLDMAFGVGMDFGFLPYVRALSGVAWDQFRLVSAESALESETVEVPPEEEDFGAAGAGSLTDAAPTALDSRVTALEDMIVGLSQNMEKLVESMEPKGRKKKSQAPRVFIDPTPKVIPSSRTTSASPSASSKYPSLDKSVVAAALAAGIDHGSLEDMERLMSSNLAGAKKLREPALKKAPGAAASSAAAVLSESEEEEEPTAEESGLGEESSPSGGGVASSIAKLTEIVALLTQDKVKKLKSSKVDQALDGISGSGSVDAPGGGSAKRAAAARRVLRQALLEHPEDLGKMVEKLMLEDLTNQVVPPGMPTPSLNARAWVEHRSRIGSHKTAAYCCWSAAGILDDLIGGKPAHARAKAALLVLQLDQTAIDRGSWVFSSELSLEQSPPFATLAGHSLPSIADGESPFSRILDGRWAEICLSHLKDTEDFLTKRKALGRKQEEVDPNKDKVRPKVKAKSKSTSESQADA